MIGEATKLLHTVINDSARSPADVGGTGAGKGGQGGGNKKRSWDAEAPSAQPPAKR
jgi:hypothetical protein